MRYLRTTIINCILNHSLSWRGKIGLQFILSALKLLNGDSVTLVGKLYHQLIGLRRKTCSISNKLAAAVLHSETLSCTRWYLQFQILMGFCCGPGKRGHCKLSLSNTCACHLLHLQRVLKQLSLKKKHENLNISSLSSSLDSSLLFLLGGWNCSLGCNVLETWLCQGSWIRKDVSAWCWSPTHHSAFPTPTLAKPFSGVTCLWLSAGDTGQDYPLHGQQNVLVGARRAGWDWTLHQH